MAKKKKYNADSIKVLEGLEGVRKRPSLYMGPLGDPALFQMGIETWENSVDEYSSGNNDYVGIQLWGEKEQAFTIVDHGRGMPFGKHKSGKGDALTLTLTVLHAGGKFDNESYGIKKRGLHGVGVSCVNALSNFFVVYVLKKNVWHCQEFKKGIPQTKVPFKTKLSVVKEISGDLKLPTKSGTVIYFEPDFSVIGSKAKIKEDQLVDKLYDVAYLNSGLKCHIVTDNENLTYHNKEGAKGYLKEIIEQEDVVLLGKSPFIYESDLVTCAIQWSDYDGDDGVYSFVNGGFSEDGGTHLIGLNDAITKAIKANTNKRGWTAADLRYSVIGFMSVWLEDPEYDGQTKTKLVTASAKKYVSDILVEPLTKYFSNKSLCNQVVDRAINLKNANEEAKKLTKAASKIKKVSKNRNLIPGKLTQADPNARIKDIELYLVEGDSAGGTCKKARNRKFQEVLALKGKVLNVAKTKSISKIFGNEGIKNILTAIGIDVSKTGKERYKNLRVGKVMLLMDADFDGYHIQILVLTVLMKFAPKLIQNGRVFAVNPPKYVAKYKGKRYFGHTHTDIKSKLPSKAPNDSISYLKGLGEMSWEALKETALDKKTRSVTKIKIVKGKELSYFNKMVGDNVQTRREILKITETGIKGM